MLYKEFEKNREDILENEFCMQSDASTLPITDCPSYTPICTIGICIPLIPQHYNLTLFISS